MSRYETRHTPARDRSATLTRYQLQQEERKKLATPLDASEHEKLIRRATKAFLDVEVTASTWLSTYSTAVRKEVFDRLPQEEIERMRAARERKRWQRGW